MRRIICKLGWIGVALLLMVPVAMAQMGRLRGTVTGEDGEPFGGAVIVIHQVDLDQTRETKTRDNGSFVYAALPTGLYELTCQIDGEDVDTKNDVRIQFGETTDIDFDLQDLKQRTDALRAMMTTGEITEEQMQALSPQQRRAIRAEMDARSEELQGKKELNDAFNAAMQAKKAQQWDTAVENFEKARALAPEENVILGNLADTYFQKAQATQGAEREAALEESFSMYAQMLVLSPSDDTTLNNYALALYLAGRYDEGRSTLEKAIQLNPSKAGMYYYNLGASLLAIDMSNQEAACEAFAKAVEVGTYASAFLQHGNCLMNKMTLSEDGAIIPAPGTKEAFEKYLEAEPDGPDAEAARQAIQILGMSVETEASGQN